MLLILLRYYEDLPSNLLIVLFLPAYSKWYKINLLPVVEHSKVLHNEPLWCFARERERPRASLIHAVRLFSIPADCSFWVDKSFGKSRFMASFGMSYWTLGYYILPSAFTYFTLHTRILGRFPGIWTWLQDIQRRTLFWPRRRRKRRLRQRVGRLERTEVKEEGRGGGKGTRCSEVDKDL